MQRKLKIKDLTPGGEAKARSAAASPLAAPPGAAHRGQRGGQDTGATIPPADQAEKMLAGNRLSPRGRDYREGEYNGKKGWG